MAITESSRNELHNDLARTIGNRSAGTLMEMLPPVGWADVATKRDLDQMAAATSKDLEQLAATSRKDLDHLADVVDSRVDALRAEHKALATQKDLRQVLYTVLAFNLALVGAVLGMTGLS